MAKSTPVRKPLFEIGLLAAGVASALIAVSFDAKAWLTASLLICVFSALAAVVTLQLSKLAPAVQVGALIVGIVGVALGAYWWSEHRDEPEIFSPTFLGYLGAAVVLSAALNLISRSRSIP